ncbi:MULTISPECIES: regulatory protein ToxS [Vibrio]|uniref:Transmembrane regulatory protein ToxS n=1 Tax=Vibrio algicola TaxID=2662262 RepID=A0A5Q0THD0_9VIBR|nr:MULTISPECIES: regulatory protein ToxS [Vibrio]MBD1575879.1 hypothetical protein [Vibrio sp. S11_S32]
MKKIITTVALASSIIFSGWVYWHSDFKLKKVLISREWQSTLVAHMSEWNKSHIVDKAKIISNVKYLPNGTYLKISSLNLYSKKFKQPIELNISESGQWELSDHYIIITPEVFKDTSTAITAGLSKPQLTHIKQLFKVSSQQSRKIDVINDNALLLTTLEHGSTILYSQ